MGTGTLEARLKATISPKISGRVCEILVDQGDRVAAGQLLVRLDQEELVEQVEMAEAGLAAAQAALGGAKRSGPRPRRSWSTPVASMTAFAASRSARP